MSRRNVFLKFDEWELICKELSDHKHHAFQLTPLQLREWEDDMEKYSHCDVYKFERVGIYPAVERVKSARAKNILYREDWRDQDLFHVMKYPGSFIGFILNYVDDVSMDTTFEEWEDIRKKMNQYIDESGQNDWYSNQLIDVYHKVI